MPSKLPAVSEQRRQGINLRVVTDNISVAVAKADAAKDGDTPSRSSSRSTAAVAAAGLPFLGMPGLIDIARVLHGHPAWSWRAS